MRAPACVSELCQCRLPFSLGNCGREVERVSCRAMRPKLKSQPGDFLLRLQAALTYTILRGSPRLLPFSPSTKHLQQYTSVIILDIFGHFSNLPYQQIHPSKHQIYQTHKPNYPQSLLYLSPWTHPHQGM